MKQYLNIFDNLAGILREATRGKSEACSAGQPRIEQALLRLQCVPNTRDFIATPSMSESVLVSGHAFGKRDSHG